jgi:hypothetical protein
MSSNFEDPTIRSPRNPDGLPEDVIRGFLRILESVRVQDMPCSEVFARLDEYVEHEVLDHEAAKLMPLLKEHFDICPDCCAEYEALLGVLEQSQSRGDAVPPELGRGP